MKDLRIGCSCFSLISKQKNAYWFRTCDMNKDLNVWNLKSNIIHVLKGNKIEFININEIQSKYNIIGITFGKSNTRLLDGMNEKGLVGGLLFLLEGTSVNIKDIEKDDKYIKIEGMEFLTYILSQCKDADEVEKMAKKVQILDVDYKNISKKSTIHYTFTDQKGRNIVLEALNNGKFTIYRNTIGVMTNSPIYQHHIENLKWFISNSLELKNGRNDIKLPKISKMVFDGVEINGDKNAKTYLRSNIFPGSYVSYDRFIRIAVLKFLNDCGNNMEDDEILIQGSKILSSVIVPNTKGYFYYNYLINDINVIEHDLKGTIMYGGGDDYTQYEVMYDTRKLEMYIKKEGSLNWAKITIN